MDSTAKRAKSRTARKLADYLVSIGVLKTDRIYQAFASVDRRDFLPPGQVASALADHPLPIGEGQTNSQPATVAMMLEWLAPQPGNRALDVGAGSGWTTALLAHCVTEKGSVLGLERHPNLVGFGQSNLAKYGFPHAEIKQADAQLGRAEEGPYDRILVSASARQVPDILVRQLARHGKMVVPVASDVLEVTPADGQAPRVARHPGFRFVPLIDKESAGDDLVD